MVEKLVSMHEDEVPALACVQELRELFASLRWRSSVESGILPFAARFTLFGVIELEFANSDLTEVGR